MVAIKQPEKSGGAMSKANSRQRRSHLRKRMRYYARMFGIFTREGVNSKRLGRKLRVRAKSGTLVPNSPSGR